MSDTNLKERKCQVSISKVLSPIYNNIFLELPLYESIRVDIRKVISVPIIAVKLYGITCHHS